MIFFLSVHFVVLVVSIFPDIKKFPALWRCAKWDWIINLLRKVCGDEGLNGFLVKPRILSISWGTDTAAFLAPQQIFKFNTPVSSTSIHPQLVKTLMIYCPFFVLLLCTRHLYNVLSLYFCCLPATYIMYFLCTFVVYPQPI